MTTTPPTVTLTPLPGIPLIQAGDDLAALILAALAAAELTFQAGDVIVVTSKIVSKAENRLVRLDTITPRLEAVQLAAETEKDPRIVELILRESVEISRQRPGVLITRHRLGFTSANAGIDQSNIGGDDEYALLLPVDPDESARGLRAAFAAATGVSVGVVVSDSHGRPHRFGTIGIAIGVAGLPALLDLRGTTDMFGRVQQVSVQGYADMIASAANLVAGEGAEGKPVVLVRGLSFPPQDGQASDINRPADQDLYR